jgi:hypothetical protein
VAIYRKDKKYRSSVVKLYRLFIIAYQALFYGKFATIV